MKYDTVSMPAVRRLPRYYRFLSELKKSGCSRISSMELSKKMGLTASQIRQDFNRFGDFGQQGYGYNVDVLCAQIGEILGIQEQKSCILIGAGNLGRAIAAHLPFSSLGFSLTGIFDADEKLSGQLLGGLKIQPYTQAVAFCQKNMPRMAILCIPREAAPTVAKDLYGAGVRAFWNFSHCDFSLLYPDIVVENVHLNDSLMTLSYKLSEEKSE